MKKYMGVPLPQPKKNHLRVLLGGENLPSWKTTH